MVKACGAVGAPLVALVLPKCPLCLLPFLALFGISVPIGEVSWWLAIAAMLSLGAFAAFSPVLLSRLSSLGAAPLVAAGRTLNMNTAYWLGVTLAIVAIALHLRATLARRRSAVSCGRCDA